MEQPMRLEGRVDELAKRLAGVETELWILTEGTLDDRDSMLERVDRIARLDAELAQLDRNLQAEVVARVKAHCTCTHEKRMHANATDGCLVSGCRCETYTGEGRAEEALSGNGRDQERAQPVRAAPPGAQALDVAGEGREPSRQAAPSPAPSVPAPVCEVCGDTDPMFRLGGVWRCSECHREHHDKMRAQPAPATGKVPEWVGVLAKLNDAHEIVCKVASDRREWRMSIPVRDTDTDMMLSDAINAAENCIRRLIASRSPSKLPTPEDVAAPIRAALEASRSPSHELVEAADAMRDQYVEQWQAMYENDDTPDTALAYDTARARHAESAQPSGATDPASYGGIPIVSDPSLRPGEIVAMSAGKEVGRIVDASAQGEVCECGHGRAMHFDEDGDHKGACLYQMNDKPFCRCDMFRAKDKERA